MDNYSSVLLQMEHFGVVFRSQDLPLEIDYPKRKTCGQGGKWWYWLRTFRPDAGGAYIVGRFGCYKNGGSNAKVQVDWKPLSDAERARYTAEREAAQVKALAERKAEAELAAMDALALWRNASAKGSSPYLERKGVIGESCRYLPDGTLVILLLRYDLDRASAVQAAQRILPDGSKFFTKGFNKPGCCVRLGAIDDAPRIILVSEGYATGLTIRVATEYAFPVFVALDAGNLVHVVPMLRTLYPQSRILICADDDWRTRHPQTGDLNNPGRTYAKVVAKEVLGCDLVWPVFNSKTRKDKDTDFDDLRQREGIMAVRDQLVGVIGAMGRKYG